MEKKKKGSRNGEQVNAKGVVPPQPSAAPLKDVGGSRERYTFSVGAPTKKSCYQEGVGLAFKICYGVNVGMYGVELAPGEQRPEDKRQGPIVKMVNVEQKGGTG